MASLFFVGCTMHPQGEKAERALAAREAGKAGYGQTFENRVLPELKADATSEQLVQYALLASGDVEAKYWAWRAALEQVPVDGTQKTGLELSLQQMLMNGTSALENTTLGIANDGMNSLQTPTKLSTDARRALHEAQAAGRRFDEARWALRNQVLAAYDDYALTAEEARLEDANGQVLDLMARVTETRLTTGQSTQTDLLKAENELAMSRNTAAGYRGKLGAQRAMLNGLLGRAADAPLDVPMALPEPRRLAVSDSDLLAGAARNNPELQALGHEAQAGQDALARAKQEYIPDFNVSFSTDLAGVTQALMGSLVLPYLRHEALDAGIRQAEANWHQTVAMQRQTVRNQAARVVADLAMLREAERQSDVIDKELLLRAQRILDAAQTAYAQGNDMMLDLLEAQRTILSLRRMAAEMRIEREKQVADLEEVSGGLPQ